MTAWDQGNIMVAGQNIVSSCQGANVWFPVAASFLLSSPNTKFQLCQDVQKISYPFPRDEYGHSKISNQCLSI